MDFATDPNNCGGCGLPCGQTSEGQNLYCNAGFCQPQYGYGSSCAPNGTAGVFAGACCSLHLDESGSCACIASASAGCASDGNCCSGHCDTTRGVCQ